MYGFFNELVFIKAKKIININLENYFFDESQEIFYIIKKIF